MPAGATAGFDMVFAISARTFGALIEGIIRPVLFSLGPPIPVTGGTLNFNDMRVEAWFGVRVAPNASPNGVEIRIGLQNASYSSPLLGAVSFGPGWSDFFVPATIAVAPAGTGFVDLTLTFNFAQTTFDADNEVPLTNAGLSEQQIASMLGPAMTGTGVANPVSLTKGTFIALVPVTPAAAAGAFPGVSVVAVAVQRRPSGPTPGEEAVAFLFTFQNRPDTPAGVAPGNAATLPASTFGVGQDLLLDIGNRFLFELLASLALEAPTGLGVPAGSVAATAAGITLTAPVALTLGGTAGTLTVFTLGAPSAGSAVLPLAMTFVFVLDFITYTVAITGATLTIGMSGTSLVVSSAIPAATVTSVVPWWVTVVRILGGAALGSLSGNIVIAAIGATVGGLSVIAETAIVSAIAGPATTAGLGGATSGLGGGLLPPTITALTGGGTLSPPLVFDDLHVGGRAAMPDVVSVLRRVSALEALSGAMIDLDSAKVTRSVVGLGPAGRVQGGDLGWDDAFGLSTATNVRMVMMSGRFSATSYSDVSAALASGSTNSIGLSNIPRVSAHDLNAGTLPAGRLLGVMTNRGRLAKVLAWRNAHGILVLRYVLWDATVAAVRINPPWPYWSPTSLQNNRLDIDTSGEILGPSEHQTNVTALVHRMSGPVTFRWTLKGVTLVGDGTATIAGAKVTWSANGAQLNLKVAEGDSLDHVDLVCEATDAQGLSATDSAQLTSGQGAYTRSVYEGALSESVRDAMQEWVALPPMSGAPLAPDPGLFESEVITTDSQIRSAIKLADATIDVDSLPIR